MDIPVECPQCSRQNETTLESIDSRSHIQCVSCGSLFAIGDVYERLYEEEPLVKNSIDAVVRYAASQEQLQVANKKSLHETEQFLDRIGFKDLLRLAARQILVHGNGFLRIVRTHKETAKWELLPPQGVVVKTSWAKERGLKALVLAEDQYVLTTKTGTVSLTPDDVVHFKKSLFSYEQVPYGVSMIEICLTYLHYLREYKRSPVRTDPEWQWWYDYLEDQIILGLGVPRFVLEQRPDGLDPTIAQFVVAPFVHEVNEVKEILSDGFNSALKQFTRERGFDEPPKIRLGRLTDRRVIIDCGFSFNKEIEALKGLHKAGIITDKELENMLKEYLA